MQTFCVCGDKLWHYDAVSFFGSRVSFCPPRRRSRVVSMVAKRSPKRLKYTSASRFTKEDGLVHIEADPSASDSWKLEPIVNLLKQGAVGVIPTDTMYSIVCDLRSHSAIERLRRIKNIEASKPLSILCHSFWDIDKYTAGFPRGDGQGHANLFKAVKQYLPGPVCMLPGSKEKYINEFANILMIFWRGKVSWCNLPFSIETRNYLTTLLNLIK
ncbi:hypothetical protein AAZX31_16G053100 [Glycine max]